MDPEKVLQLFSLFPNNPSQAEYDNFMVTVFEKDNGAFSVVRKVVPSDYTSELPPWMRDLQIPKKLFVEFVLDLKRRWSHLCCEFVIDEGSINKVRSSLIPLPHPFFIPGGRFRECYYWDSLWIVKGLVASQMLSSAQGVVRNLLHLIDRIGFVPNGNRVYYLNRSQPPVLTLCVGVIYDAINKKADRLSWLREALPTLEKEYRWFAQQRSAFLPSTDPNHNDLSLSCYNVNNTLPRPESFLEDESTLELLRQKVQPRNLNIEEIEKLYKNLASCAESGWDFSTRWLSDLGEGGLESAQICDIVPCCLNGILLKVERRLAEFHRILSGEDADIETRKTLSSSALGNDEDPKHHLDASQFYEHLAQRRQRSIQKLLWDEEKGFWFDYNAAEGKLCETISCAGLYPLWAHSWDPKWSLKEARKFVDFIVNSSGLLHPGGLACTSRTSPEQWDFPNCWPPLVDIAVEGLKCLGKRFPGSGAEKAAETIAMRFLETAYRGWLKDGAMHEKYDCKASNGQRGEGGEYRPQTGFGWTNGTILWLLQDYGDLFNYFTSDIPLQL